MLKKGRVLRVGKVEREDMKIRYTTSSGASRMYDRAYDRTAKNSRINKYEDGRTPFVGRLFLLHFLPVDQASAPQMRGKDLKWGVKGRGEMR